MWRRALCKATTALLRIQTRGLHQARCGHQGTIRVSAQTCSAHLQCCCALLTSCRSGSALNRRRRRPATASASAPPQQQQQSSVACSSSDELEGARQRSPLDESAMKEEGDDDEEGGVYRGGEQELEVHGGIHMSDPLGTLAATEEEDASAAGSAAPAVEHNQVDDDGEELRAPQRTEEEQYESKHLLDVLPELAAEYAADNAKPVEEVMVDDADVASWCCPKCSQSWRCGVFIRCILRSQCPACTARRQATVATRRPDLVALWDRARNDPFATPEETAADSPKVAYWVCPTCSQSYTARVKDRVADKQQCPSCALMRMHSADLLAHEESALLHEWHPMKNGDLRLDQLQLTDQKTKVWWLCTQCGHDWEATVAARLSRSRRSKGKNCPVCKGQGA